MALVSGIFFGSSPESVGARVPCGGVLKAFLRHFQGKKNGLDFDLEKESALTARAARAKRDILPALTWLSLVRLLASRARLRFTRQETA